MMNFENIGADGRTLKQRATLCVGLDLYECPGNSNHKVVKQRLGKEKWVIALGYRGFGGNENNFKLDMTEALVAQYCG